ncbi:MAG: hypothetical protein H0U27_13275, partial [Nitrosopumilus sp.]|nr:hypothetical protein [Nitrosopumilus sp.]
MKGQKYEQNINFRNPRRSNQQLSTDCRFFINLMLNQNADKNYQTTMFAGQENQDLGFGSVVARESRQ